VYHFVFNEDVLITRGKLSLGLSFGNQIIPIRIICFPLEIHDTDPAPASLQQEYVCWGKAKVFDALNVFLTGDKSEAIYEEIGKGLQVSESAVKMAVSRLRRRYGERLRREIARTITDPAVVEEELCHLVGALSR
jgi:hypothetical protein